MATIAEALALVAQAIDTQAKAQQVSINFLAGEMLKVKERVLVLEQNGVDIPQALIDQLAALSQPVTLPDVEPAP